MQVLHSSFSKSKTFEGLLSLYAPHASLRLFSVIKSPLNLFQTRFKTDYLQSNFPCTLYQVHFKPKINRCVFSSQHSLVIFKLHSFVKVFQ